MNTLETFLHSTGQNEIRAMNRLQNYGIVSDNAIMAADVSEEDCTMAVAFLKKPEGREND